MRLPDMTIPDIPLPIEIAAHIHPSVVHFAIVIPVIVLLLDVYNVAAKRPSISLFSFFLLLVLVFVLASSYLTGDVDAKNALQFFSNEAKVELKEHKQIGIFLLYASFILLALKLLFMSIQKTWGRILFIMIQSLFVLAILFQSKQGGILVYKHGANVETVRTLRHSSSEITANNKKMSEHLKALEMENSQLKQKNQALAKSISNLDALKKKAEETAANAKRDANMTMSTAQKEALKLFNESKIKADTLLSNSKKEAEMLLNNSKKEAEALSISSKEEAKTLLSDSKKEADVSLLRSKNEAATILRKSKNEAADILVKANRAAQIVIRNTQESVSALARAKRLIDNATANVVSTSTIHPKVIDKDKNESNASH